MNFLSSAITAFCAACIFIGTLYILCPEGAVSKSVKYILSLDVNSLVTTIVLSNFI